MWLTCGQKVVDCLMVLVDRRYWYLSWAVVFMTNTIFMWVTLLLM